MLTLNEGRRQTSDAAPSILRASVGGTGIPTSIPRDSWEQLDDVDLEEVFLRRTPMLRSCPHFSRGRVRHCFTVTWERSRAKLEEATFFGKISGEPHGMWRRIEKTRPQCVQLRETRVGVTSTAGISRCGFGPEDSRRLSCETADHKSRSARFQLRCWPATRRQ